jgi:hypothetical protein
VPRVEVVPLNDEVSGSLLRGKASKRRGFRIDPIFSCTAHECASAESGGEAAWENLQRVFFQSVLKK